jgi:hypothetical protein
MDSNTSRHESLARRPPEIALPPQSRRHAVTGTRPQSRCPHYVTRSRVARNHGSPFRVRAAFSRRPFRHGQPSPHPSESASDYVRASLHPGHPSSSSIPSHQFLSESAVCLLHQPEPSAPARRVRVASPVPWLSESAAPSRTRALHFEEVQSPWGRVSWEEDSPPPTETPRAQSRCLLPPRDVGDLAALVKARTPRRGGPSCRNK